MEIKTLSDSKYYKNRELSWLQFNERVLEEARDESNPLFERMRFLSIFSSNIDEFTIIRVASLIDMMHARYDKPDISGMLPEVSLSLISQKMHEMYVELYNVYNKIELSELRKHDIRLISKFYEMNEIQAKMSDEYFDKKVFPVLTPVVIDSKHPFPLVKNEAINVCALVRRNEDEEFRPAIIRVPELLNRVVELPMKHGQRCFILLEEIIKRNIKKLLPKFEILSLSTFRIMRNADLAIDEEDAEDLLKEIEEQIHKREWGEIIKLDCSRDMDIRLSTLLTEEFKTNRRSTYYMNGPLDLTFLEEIYQACDYDNLKEKAFEAEVDPDMTEGMSIFDAIDKKDRLLITPFESYNPVERFITEAAYDPNVVSIKQTLYRVGRDSSIVKALVHAAESGKEVTVLVELKARFDEKNNILWARALEQAGCNVIYGPAGLKTHAKIALVIREDEGEIKQYLHLGSGNYNVNTAKRYTDVSLLTSNPDYTKDAGRFFYALSLGEHDELPEKLVVAPFVLKKKLIELIDNEIENSKGSKEARIIAKMNSLCDPDIIHKLYEASCNGVRIELIVRGICSLKAGIRGISENISVKSIVGRFLEHSRVFYFENAGDPRYFCSSADWMPRNLERRIEIMFPVEDEECKAKLHSYLQDLLRDNVKGRYLLSDGEYYRKETEDRYSYQEEYIHRRKY